MPINFAALLLSPKAWGAVGVILLLLFAGIQTGRLAHAKADQWDRTACVKTAPCKPVKWKVEVEELRPALAAKTRDLGTCHASEANLAAALDRQSADVAAYAAERSAQTAASARAVLGVRQAADGLRRSALQALAAKPGADACQSADDLILRGLQ